MNSKFLKLVFLIFLAGCASKYTYNNVGYSSSSEALSALNNDLNSALFDINAHENPINGHAWVVIPTYPYLKANGVVYSELTPEEYVDYVTTTLERGFVGMFEALRKKGLFYKTSLLRVDDQSFLNSYEGFYIWLEIKNKSSAQWYMSAKGSDIKVPIYMDQGLGNISLRANSWFDNIEKAYEDNFLKIAGRRKGRDLGETVKVVPTNESKKKSSGTGFVVNKEGHILTNSHVVNGCKQIFVKINGDKIASSLKAQDQINDLAVVKANHPFSQIVEFGESNKVRAGDKIIVVGYPLGGLLASSLNVSTGDINALAGILNDIRYFQLSAPIQPGNSGGPVFNSAGKVVGIVVSKINALKLAKITGDIPQNINFAIKGSVTQNFLSSNSVDYVANDSSESLKTSTVTKAAEETVFPIECWN